MNEVYRKKLDENGQPALNENGDFIMELVESTEVVININDIKI